MKTTKEERKEIRELRASGVAYKELSNRYKLSMSSLYAIVNNTFKHDNPPISNKGKNQKKYIEELEAKLAIAKEALDAISQGKFCVENNIVYTNSAYDCFTKTAKEALEKIDD